MKDNTSQAKSLLEQAIKNMPGDFSLGEARHLMHAALASIAKVESKRTSRQAAQDMVAKAMDDRRQAGFVGGAGGYSMTAQEAHMAVMNLDKMIQRERKVLEQLGQIGSPSAGKPTRVQTLHS
jgi:hypothetical protein